VGSVNDPYGELFRLTPPEREALLHLVRKAERAGHLKAEEYAWRDAQMRIPKSIYLATRAPHGVWIATILRPNDAGGWMSASVHIPPLDAPPRKGA
jgi:hypothetical protein